MVEIKCFPFLPVTIKWFLGSVTNANAQSRIERITEKACRNPGDEFTLVHILNQEKLTMFQHQA